MPDADDSSPALKDIPCSGAELRFTVWVVGEEADGACQAALFGVAELTPGVNNGFPPGCMYTRAHTQANLMLVEEMSRVSVVTSTVPAAPCSASSGLLHTLWDAQPGSTQGDQ